MIENKKQSCSQRWPTIKGKQQLENARTVSVAIEMDNKENYRLSDTYARLIDVMDIAMWELDLDGQAQEILDRGCEGFIQKPFGIDDLSAKIHEIMR